MSDFQGRVWKFGDNVDTDAIVPGQYLDAELEEIAPHVLENLNPEFASAMRAGDILIGGKNFGCGSSREQAAHVLKQMGISCVIAESFGRIFFRNAVAIGLPVMTCRGISDAFIGGQSAFVSLEDARIKNLENSALLQGDPLSVQMRSILEMGGILEYLKEVGEGKRECGKKDRKKLLLRTCWHRSPSDR